MSIWEHITTFDGKPVVPYVPGQKPEAPLESVALRVGQPDEYLDGGPQVSDLIGQLAAEPWAREVRNIVLGGWASWEEDDDAERICQALVAAHEPLSGLEALFFADITAEESEISWIQHTDVSPILAAFPKLQTLQLRGGGIRFGRGGHVSLRTLVVQSGGMLPEGVVDIAQSDWPALEHLELWLGTDEYGGGTTPLQLARILSGEGLPSLRWLGLMNSDRQDGVAEAVSRAAVLRRINVLDLSMGTLSDKGATWLLGSADVRRVSRVNLRHNYIGEGLTEALGALPNVVGVEEKGDDYGGDSDWRYVEVSE